MHTRRSHLACALGAALALLALPTQAQDKPPLKIMVGFPPGGSADVLARLIGDAIKDDFSSVIVDNKPGAGGRLALNLTKRAPADGQTVVLLPSGPMVLFPHVYKQAGLRPGGRLHAHLAAGELPVQRGGGAGRRHQVGGGDAGQGPQPPRAQPPTARPGPARCRTSWG
jgi:hypothetical protein